MEGVGLKEMVSQKVNCWLSPKAGIRYLRPSVQNARDTIVVLAGEYLEHER